MTPSESSSEIEGEWNNIMISLATLEDFDEISEMLRNSFYRDEPLNKILDWSEEKVGDHDLMIRAVLSHGISLKASEKVTNKIIGVRLTIDSRQYMDLESLNFESKQTEKILYIKKKLDTDVNLKQRYKISFFAEFLMACVVEKYRRIGLATELYRRSVSLLKLQGFPLVKSAITSPFSREIATKLGFEELSRIYLFDECDEDGESLFPNASPDQYVALMALKL